MSEDNNRYLGIFLFRDKQMPGEITLNKETGNIKLKLTLSYPDWDSLSAVLFAPREDGAQSSWRKQRYPVIKGRLHTGDDVALFNCTLTSEITNDLTQQFTLFADYILWDEVGESEPKYDRFTVVIENGLLWSGISQISRNIDARDNSHQIHFQQRKSYKKRTWSGVKIKFSSYLDCVDLFQINRSEKCSVNEHLKIGIMPRDPMTVREFLKFRDQILNMICFAIKDNVNIVMQYFCNNDDYVTYMTANNTEERDYRNFFIVTNEKNHKLKKQDPRNYNFLLDDLPPKKDLGWTIGRLVPIFNLYTSFFEYSRMPLEMLFLNVTQALETFHARFFYGDRKDLYLQSVEQRFGILEYSDPLHKQLLSSASDSSITLLARINDLLVRGKDGLFSEFYVQDQNFGYRVVRSRNYYTHYPESPSIPPLEGNELFDTIQVLKWLLEYHICRQLGIDKEEKIKSLMNPNHDAQEKEDILRKLHEEGTEEM